MVIKMTEDFTRNLTYILEQIGVKKVTVGDALIIHQQLIEDIKKMERTRGGIDHQWIELKSRGRIVLPENIRVSLGATEGTRFDAYLYPGPDEPKGILLTKW